MYFVFLFFCFFVFGGKYVNVFDLIVVLVFFVSFFVYFSSF